MFNKLGMLADLMGNAGKLRESFDKAFESLGQVEVEGSAGGGTVTAKVNGRLEVVSVRIDPKLLADRRRGAAGRPGRRGGQRGPGQGP